MFYFHILYSTIEIRAMIKEKKHINKSPEKHKAKRNLFRWRYLQLRRKPRKLLSTVRCIFLNTVRSLFHSVTTLLLPSIIYIVRKVKNIVSIGNNIATCQSKTLGFVVVTKCLVCKISRNIYQMFAKFLRRISEMPLEKSYLRAKYT